MDTQDSDPVSTAIRNLGQCFNAQEEQVRRFHQDLSGMAKRQEDFLATVSEQLSAVSPLLTQPRRALNIAPEISSQVLIPTSAPTPTQLARPGRFSGDTGDCRPFLVQCEMHFE